MKRLVILLLLTACSKDDEPVFRIEGGTYFQSRFDEFVDIASWHDVTIPRNNLIFRPVDDDNDSFNDSKAYKNGDQLYVDIDKKFIDVQSTDGSDVSRVIFQQLANGLLGTNFRNCGIMKKVVTATDLTGEDWDDSDYPNLFDPSSPCP